MSQCDCEITETLIHDCYQSVLGEVANIVPLEQWRVQPRKLGFSTHKSKYGQATPDGQVLINTIFVGTSSHTKLDQTMRHELAHLAVGLHHHHDKHFRRMERRFGVDPTLDLTQELDQLQDKITFKYTVIAHLMDGRVRELGGVHRKTKVYSQYPRDGKYTMSIDGVRVEWFEFLENRV